MYFVFALVSPYLPSSVHEMAVESIHVLEYILYTFMITSHGRDAVAGEAGEAVAQRRKIFR